MSAIKPGDLVQVIRPQPCCGATDSIGKVFTVAAVWTGKGFCDCGAVYTATTVFSDVAMPAGYVASRLKRIDPLPAEDDIEHREAIEA